MNKSNNYNETVVLSQQTWAKLHLQTVWLLHFGFKGEVVHTAQTTSVIFFPSQKSNTNSAINRFSLNSSAAAPRRAPNITGHKKWKAGERHRLEAFIHSSLLNLTQIVELQWPLQSEGSGVEGSDAVILLQVFTENRVDAEINVHKANACLNTTTVVYLMSICLNILKYACLHVCLAWLQKSGSPVFHQILQWRSFH